MKKSFIKFLSFYPVRLAFSLFLILGFLLPAIADESQSQNKISVDEFLKTEAVQSFKKGDHANALSGFRQLSEQYSEDPLIYRYLGMTLTLLGQYDEALSAFEIAVKLDPDNAATHYFYARAYYAKGDNAQAEKEIQEVLRLDSEGYYGGAAKRAMSMMRPTRFFPKPKRWNVFGSVGFEYDSNVTLEPNDKAISFSNDSNAFRYYFSLGGYYNWLERGKFNSYVGYKVSQSLHDDGLDEFNFTFQEFWIWNEYITNWFGKEVILGFRYALPWGFLNGNLFSIGNEFMTNIKVRFTKRTQTEVFTKYTHYEFGPDGYLPDVTSRDGEYTSTGIVHTFYFSNFRRSVFAAYILDTASTQGNNFDRTGHTAQVGFRTPVWDGVRILKDLTLELIGEFTAANYYHFDSQVYYLEPNARLNNDWSFLVRLTYPISRHWSVQAYYRYINANNKNDIYQYDRQLGGAVLRFQY